MRSADAVNLDQDAVAADPADGEALVAGAAGRTDRRTEPRRSAAHGNAGLEAHQILDVGGELVGDVFGGDDGDSGGGCLLQHRGAGGGDGDAAGLLLAVRLRRARGILGKGGAGTQRERGSGKSEFGNKGHADGILLEERTSPC